MTTNEKTLEATGISPQQDQQKAEFFDQQTGAFFRKVDWSAFWTAFLISFGVYIFTLAPTVTLEDSGELAVAADYLGVPHPPGYPIWSLLAWLFQWIFHFVTYYGQPNPAWSVGLMSAFFGALACGLLALLVSRSGADMLRGMKHTTEVLGYATESMLCWAGGVASGLLLAFSPVLWSQSVIVEVYSLNAFFLVLLMLLTYWWMCRPKDDAILYITAFIFASASPTTRPCCSSALALLAAIWFRDRALFRDCLALLFVFVAGLLFMKATKMAGGEGTTPQMTRAKILTEILGFLFLVSPVGLFMIERKLMTEWKRVVLVVASVGLGLSFYAYMPFASEQNPPMNWGYPRTMEGFKHAISRGQYEKVVLSNIFGNPKRFMEQLGAYFRDLRGQFTLPIVIIGILPFFFMSKLDKKMRDWLTTTLWAFVALSIVLVIFLNPKLDIQTLFIQRVQLIQSHAVFALWLGYGLMFGLTLIETSLAGRGVSRYFAVALVALLPFVSIYQNWKDPERLPRRRRHGTERTQFRMAIRQLAAPRCQRHSRGDQRGGKGGLPESRLSARDGHERRLLRRHRPGTVRAHVHDLLREGPLRRVPHHTERAGRQHVHERNARPVWRRDLDPLPAGQQLRVPEIRTGRTGRQDPGGRRRELQERARERTGRAGRDDDQRDSRPHDLRGEQAQARFLRRGKLRDPMDVPLPPAAWSDHEDQPGAYAQPGPRTCEERPRLLGWYTARLMENKKFKRDVVARKTFSKLRSAIAGLYAARRMFGEAEHAFKQAIDLYPLSPEANFRLADVYMQQRRFADARIIIEAFLEQDPGNAKVRDFLNQIIGTEGADNRRRELETAFAEQHATIEHAFELAQLYQRLNMGPHFEQLTAKIIDDPNLPPQMVLRVGQMYAETKRFDLLANALKKYLAREPANPRVWIDLAAAQVASQQADDGMESLKQAIALGGEPVRDIARKDPRFDPVRQNDAFKALVPQLQSAVPLPLPGL